MKTGIGIRFLAGFALVSLMGAHAMAQQALVIGKDWTITLGENAGTAESATVSDAIEKQWVEVEFRVDSGPRGLNLSANLKNLTHKPLQLQLSAGSMLYCKTETSPGPVLGKTFNPVSNGEERKSLPVEGGTISGIEALCAQYFLPTPDRGTHYYPAPVGEQPKPAKNRREPVPDNSPKKLESEFPPGWLNEDGLRDAEARAQALVVWAESGVQAASTPFDMLLLPEVRNRLDRLGVADPYRSVPTSAPKSPADYIVRVSDFAGQVPRDWAALETAYPSKKTAAVDLDNRGAFRAIVPSEQGPAFQNGLIVQTVPEQMLKQAKTFMGNYLPGTPIPKSMEDLETQVKSADTALEEILSTLPTQLATDLRKEREDILKHFGERTAQTLSRACTKNLLEGADVPGGLVEAWRRLSPLNRFQLANCLRVVAESNPSVSGQDALVRKVFSAAPTEITPFLKEWDKIIESKAAAMSESVNVLSARTVLPDMLSQKVRGAWKANVLSEETTLALENAFLVCAEAAELVTQSRKVLESGLMQEFKSAGEQKIASMATMAEEGKKELVGVNPIRALGMAIAEQRDKPLSSLSDRVPGKRIALVAHSLLSQMRRMSGSSLQVVYRMPEALGDLVDLSFWNDFFERLKLPGFETHKDFIATRKHNIAQALASIERVPSDEEVIVIAVTIPLSLTEKEFVESNSDFVVALKNNNPHLTATGYNKFVGAPLKEKLDRIQRNHPKVKLCRTFAELKALFESDGHPRDCTLNLTIVAHNISGVDQIEFPDRADGVAGKELMGIFDGYLGKGLRSLETNLIVCWAGVKHVADFLRSPYMRPTTAPRGEIRPETGLALLERTLDLKKTGIPFWKVHAEARREFIDDILGPWKDGKPPVHVLVDSVDSIPGPEAENRNPDEKASSSPERLPTG